MTTQGSICAQLEQLFERPLGDVDTFAVEDETHASQFHASVEPTNAKNVVLFTRSTKYDPSLTVNEIERMRSQVKQGLSPTKARKEANRMSALKSRMIRKAKLELMSTSQARLEEAIKETRGNEKVAMDLARDILFAFQSYCMDQGMGMPSSLTSFDTRLSDLSEQVDFKNRRIDDIIESARVSTWNSK